MPVNPTEYINGRNQLAGHESEEAVTSDQSRELGAATLREAMATNDAHERESQPDYDYIAEAICGDDNEEWKAQARVLFAQTLPEIVQHKKSEALGRHVLDGADKSRAAIQAIGKLRQQNESTPLGKYDDQLKLNKLAGVLLAKQPASAALIDKLKQYIRGNDLLKDLSDNQVACLAVGIIDKLCVERDAPEETPRTQ